MIGWLQKRFHKTPVITIDSSFSHQKDFIRFELSLRSIKLKIARERIWVHKDEVLDSIEVFEEDRMQFYSYTYKVMMEDDWVPLVRFDNWETGSHYDKYDENGSLMKQSPCTKKSLEEVARLVKEFRRNLLTMDISTL